MKFEDVKITPLAGNKFKVLEPITYKDVTVPAGYITNGADVPRIFWSIYPPNKSDFFPAVIIHDYLCDLGLYKKADEYFKEILESLGARDRDIFVLYRSVVFYHRVRYYKIYDKQQIKK